MISEFESLKISQGNRPYSINKIERDDNFLFTGGMRPSIDETLQSQALNQRFVIWNFYTNFT